MTKTTFTQLTDFRVEGSVVYFTLNERRLRLEVEEHMRAHIVRQTTGYAGFAVMASSPYARIEELRYTPELREMDEDELTELVKLFKEDIHEETDD